MGVFLGWMPDAATRAALAELQQRIGKALPADAPRHEWSMPAQWHMTLRYLGKSIGDAQRARIEAAMEALASRTDAADAALAGARYWPHARVLVAEVDASAELKALLKGLEAAAQGCGFPREPAQTAHITLAHLPRGAKPPVLPELASTPAAISIDRMQLLRTVPGGYLPLASWPFAPPTPS